MILIGHPWVKSQHFYRVSSLEEIKNTQTTAMVLLETLDLSHEIAQYCQKNQVAYALQAERIEDAILANALGAKYVICSKTSATQLQTVAQEYLFDTRILALIQDEKEIAQMAKEGIDGVVFSEVMV